MFVTCQRLNVRHVIVSCDTMMVVSLSLPVLHHQPVDGDVRDFSFFAGFFHRRKQFLSSRHDAPRVVLVHEDAAGLDGSGCSQHDVAVLERREFDHDSPLSVLVGGGVGVTYSTGSFSCSCRALRSASSVSAHVSPGRSCIPSTRRLLRHD